MATWFWIVIVIVVVVIALVVAMAARRRRTAMLRQRFGSEYDRAVETHDGQRAAEAELRVLLYLLDVNTIGAGLAFRTAALTIGRDDVPAEGPRALDEVLLLLDYRVRLANDLSDFEASSGADRDEKTNACSLLLPGGTRGVEREAALMRAIGVVRRVARRIDEALDR